jgi:hypothetical protein
MDRAQISGAVDTLDFAAAPLSRPTHGQPSSQGTPAARKPIGDAADGLVLEASKVAFGQTGAGKRVLWLHACLMSSWMPMQLAVICQGSGPTREEAGALLHVLQQRFTGLCALLHSILACQPAGPTLQAAVSTAVQSLLAACREFLEALPDQVQPLSKALYKRACRRQYVKGLRSHVEHCFFATGLSCVMCMDQGKWAGLPQRVGLLSERCAAVKRLPLDNKIAIGRRLTQVRPIQKHCNSQPHLDSCDACMY